MKNVLNKIFGVSQRAIGKVDEEGIVTITNILSYDVVVDPGFSNARIDFSDTFELLEKIKRELARQKLLSNRREKIQKLNSL